MVRWKSLECTTKSNGDLNSQRLREILTCPIREALIHLHELLYVHVSNELLKDTLHNIPQRSMRMRYFVEDVSKMHDQVGG